jgi:hypothetical protein
MPGAWPHPQPRTHVKSVRVVTTGQPGDPGIPRATVLTASFALSPETGFVASVARKVASQAWHQHRDVRTTRLRRPLQRRSSYDIARVHRIPRLANRDDREAPLSSSAGRGPLLKMICPTGEMKYFCRGEWTVESALILLAKLDFWRNRLRPVQALRRYYRSGQYFSQVSKAPLSGLDF